MSLRHYGRRNKLIRFDDLTREERYYSATILPYLLAYNKFQGLKIFEEYLLKNSFPELTPESDISRIQLLTEIFLDWDLPYYKIQIPPEAFLSKKLVQSKPDLLILTNRSLYLFKCKVFTSCSEYVMHDQIMKQKYVLDIIESIADQKYETKIHFLVLPYKYDVEDCFVITWKELFEIFKNIVAGDDYFMNRLEI